MEKMTKKEKFLLAIELCAGNDMLVEFFNDEIAKLDAKADKARAKAAEKKAAGDELYAAVIAVLTDAPQTAEDVLAQIDGEDLTVAKIRARLSQAVKNGVANKESVKVDGKSKVHYTSAN